MKRHFAHPNPRFGTKNMQAPVNWWQESIYYWWFEYLRRNEDYKQTCTNGGRGKCAKVYADFGDVHAQDFKAWWTTNDRGATLFAEPPTPSIRVIKGDAIVLSSPKERTLVLEIPLDLPSTHLVKRFKEILDQHHTGKQGVKVNTSSKSQAMYPTATDRIAIDFLRTALKVWDTRKVETNMPLWLLAQELNLSPANHIKLGKDGTIPRGGHVANQKAILAATASRYIRKAEAAIKNVGTGSFPDYDAS
jgi:hypothetical protein